MCCQDPPREMLGPETISRHASPFLPPPRKCGCSSSNGRSPLSIGEVPNRNPPLRLGTQATGTGIACLVGAIPGGYPQPHFSNQSDGEKFQLIWNSAMR